ncbi:MAG: AAA family ATPase [Candidatus Dormibacteraeota bacterium]|nr:AAA family ATPase [Candidatus Dormibacteraeota bacterium]
MSGERAAAATAAEGHPPLVGRQEELSFLRSRWESAVRASRAHVVVLTGEAGIGKTRLAEELVSAVQDGATVIRARCPGYGALVGSRLALELRRQLELDGDDADRAAATLDEGEIWRVRRRIAELTTEQALLAVIDDAHNAAGADLEPLLSLAARLGDLPVLLLLSGRASPADWLSRVAGATTLRLDPLDENDCVELAGLFAGGDGLPPEIAVALAAQARGNPLHLRELLRLLRSSGSLQLSTGFELSDDRLPATLQAVLAARIDALPPDEKTVLQDVAVFSDGATAEEISALSGRPIRQSLDRLLESGLIREAENRYELTDPLLREVAYEQLPHAARAERHRRAASVATTTVGRARHLGLAARYTPDDQQLQDDAADELARAGIELLEVGRFREGSQLVHRALELGHDDSRTLLRLAQALNDAGPGGERSAELLARIDTCGDPTLEAEVLQARGNALRGTDLEQSASVLAEAAEAWERIGNPAKRAWTLANRGMSLFDLGRIADAAREHQTALEIFLGLGDRAGAAAAGQALALERPDDPRVPDWLAQGLELAEETGDLAKERNALIPLAWFRFLRTHLGDRRHTAETRRDGERLARVSNDMGDITFEVQAQCILAVLDRLEGDVTAATRKVARCRTLLGGLHEGSARQYSAVLFDAVDFIVRLAWDPAAGGCPTPADSPSPIAVVSDIIIIEALLLAGRFDEAQQQLEASALETFATASPFFSRMLAVVRGAVMICSGRLDADDAGLEEAREAALRFNAPPNAVAASAILAETYSRRGDVERARAALDAVGDDPGGFAGLLLLRARAACGEAGAGEQLAYMAQLLAAQGMTMVAATSA